MTAYDVFIVAGQSNAEGRGDHAQSPSVVDGPIMWDGVGWVPLHDPVGGASTGSAWPAFANAYHAETGRSVAVVPTAVGATALVPAADSGAGDWSGTGARYVDSVTSTQSALASPPTGEDQLVLRGVLWHQGERDAGAGIPQQDYAVALADLVDRYQADLGIAHLPLFVFRVGRPAGGDNDRFMAIRTAQDQVAQDDPDVVMAYTGCVDFPDLGWMADNLHYTQPGYDDMGDAGAVVVAMHVVLGGGGTTAPRHATVVVDGVERRVLKVRVNGVDRQVVGWRVDGVDLVVDT